MNITQQHLNFWLERHAPKSPSWAAGLRNVRMPRTPIDRLIPMGDTGRMPYRYNEVHNSLALVKLKMSSTGLTTGQALVALLDTHGSLGPGDRTAKHRRNWTRWLLRITKTAPVNQWVVRYSGFLQQVERRFPTRERAEQWARQVGMFDRCTIKEVSPHGLS